MNKLSRREELERWRSKTGRTPMKRLSYILPCAENPQPQTRVLSSKSTKRNPLMQSCKVLTPLNGKSPSRKVKTSNGKRVDSPAADAERALQQERFQRDIDDTVAQILAEQEASQNVAKELDYEDHHSTTPPKSHRKMKKHRRSSAFYVDTELAFPSSAIRYSMVASEYRGRKSQTKKRRHSSAHTPNKRLLYLTPVRRSTRRSRLICPNLRSEDILLCFDSPSQAQDSEDYDEIKIIPNDALLVSEEEGKKLHYL